MEPLRFGFKTLLMALRADLSIAWFLAPIVILWIIMELYFSEYRREPLGWNSMLGNSVSFVWIVIASLRSLESENGVGSTFWLLVLLLGYGGLMMVLAYRHSISQRFTYILTGPSTLYGASIFVVMWGQAHVPVASSASLALAVIVAAVIVVFQLLRRTIFGVRGEAEAIRAGRAPEGPRAPVDDSSEHRRGDN